MTIDKEALRQAFEKRFRRPPGVGLRPDRSAYFPSNLGAGLDALTHSMKWEAWLAAFESLGEPVAYSLDDEIGREYSDEDYFPGGRRGGTPLYRLPVGGKGAA